MIPWSVWFSQVAWIFLCHFTWQQLWEQYNVFNVCFQTFKLVPKFVFKLLFHPSLSKTTTSVYNRIAYKFTINKTVLIMEILFYSWFPKRVDESIHEQYVPNLVSSGPVQKSQQIHALSNVCPQCQCAYLCEFSHQLWRWLCKLEYARRWIYYKDLL